MTKLCLLLCLILSGAALAEDHDDERPRGNRAVDKPKPMNELGQDLALFFPALNPDDRERAFRQLAALGRDLHTGRFPDEERNARIDQIAERCLQLLPGNRNLRRALTVARERAVHFETKKVAGNYQPEYYFYEIIRAGSHTILRADGVENLGGEPRSPAESSPGAAERRLIELINERHGAK